MNETEESVKKPSLGKLGAMKPRTVAAAQNPVKRSLLAPGRPLPLVIEPERPGVDLVAWAAAHRAAVDADLLTHGGVLFRGFEPGPVERFEAVIAALSGEALEYRERSSPRSQVGGNIYTSTDYPPSQPIFFHNENSYAHRWPTRIFFYCDTAAEEGGETPIADVRRVYERIDPAVRQRFEEKGVLYVRNFGDLVGLPWQTVFQTTDRAEVEEYCRKAGYEIEWVGENGLRTRRRGRAVYRHPRTGDPVWFNHATFFHVSTLPEALRGGLVSLFAEEDLPNNTYYGDGTPIEPEVLDQLRSAYQAEAVLFPWRRGDLLALDNMLVAHARSPFQGARRVLVGMSEPVEAASLS
jgi:alpha-ketoglutarate-dependent taurine dioxygenase